MRSMNNCETNPSLIKRLEFRQNRKRGGDLAAVEYLQKIDPGIEKKKVKATLDAALNKP